MYKNGKSFSELNQTCIELFALTITLNPLKDGRVIKGKVAYILFNDTQKEAEIFFPFKNKGIVLTKTAEGNWSNSEYILMAWKGYVIHKKGIAIFGGN